MRSNHDAFTWRSHTLTDGSTTYDVYAHNAIGESVELYAALSMVDAIVTCDKLNAVLDERMGVPA